MTAAASRFEHHLAAVESLLDALATDLVRGDAAAFESQSTALRLAVAELAGATPPHLPPALQARLRAASERLNRQRQQLARRAALAQRALGVLLPAAAPATYGAPGHRASFGGNAPRIYAAPAR